MGMPETTVNENHFSFTWKNEIWLTREIFFMKAVPISKPVQQPTDYPFRPRVLRPDSLHDSATLGFLLRMSTIGLGPFLDPLKRMDYRG